MLKGIPPIIPPGLMKILLEMGHGDELLICDGLFPVYTDVDEKSKRKNDPSHR
jgi:L-fucose mutarotase/ribose pyranase (RbsD/FucU family)